VRDLFDAESGRRSESAALAKLQLDSALQAGHCEAERVGPVRQEVATTTPAPLQTHLHGINSNFESAETKPAAWASVRRLLRVRIERPPEYVARRSEQVDIRLKAEARAILRRDTSGGGDCSGFCYISAGSARGDWH
jgi:hypothetical protein